MGGIAGQLSYLSTVRNCEVSAPVTFNGNANGLYVGGIAGESYYGTIENCYVTGNVSVDNQMADKGARVGGIAGFNNGSIKNCYATGNIKAVTLSTAEAGGIAGGGLSNGSISNCYATGKIEAVTTTSAYAGGIA